MKLLQRILDAQRVLRPMPPPHPSARVYGFAESALLHRTADQARKQSKELHRA